MKSEQTPAKKSIIMTILNIVVVNK